MPCIVCRNCRDDASADEAKYGLCCCGGLASIGDAIVAADCVRGRESGVQLPKRVAVGGEIVPGRLLAGVDMLPHMDCWIWCIFFISLSFCVSANFTTNGAEQPSMV